MYNDFIKQSLPVFLENQNFVSNSANDTNVINTMINKSYAIK